jgi:hypothetical protein
MLFLALCLFLIPFYKILWYVNALIDIYTLIIFEESPSPVRVFISRLAASGLGVVDGSVKKAKNNKLYR